MPSRKLCLHFLIVVKLIPPRPYIYINKFSVDWFGFQSFKHQEMDHVSLLRSGRNVICMLQMFWTWSLRCHTCDSDTGLHLIYSLSIDQSIDIYHPGISDRSAKKALIANFQIAYRVSIPSLTVVHESPSLKIIVVLFTCIGAVSNRITTVELMVCLCPIVLTSGSSNRHSRGCISEFRFLGFVAWKIWVRCVFHL
jgi:hypothetical protein